MSDLDSVVLRQLHGDDAGAFSALRREVIAENPVPMGLTLEEELTRPLEGFREQLSFPAPNAAFGAFVGGELVGTAAVDGQYMSLLVNAVQPDVALDVR